jgi:hypothetical protein
LESEQIDEPHPDEPSGNGESASEGDEHDEGKVGEHHPDEATEPESGEPRE